LNIELLRDYCLAKPGVTESFPFDEGTLVFKVGSKIFLLTNLSSAQVFNAKCDPEKAIAIREQYEEVQPGYHMSKKHWNTIYYESLPDNLIKELVDHSYDLVFKSFSKSVQQEINK
jgi:predicted DNA-binding protein (MmcQ/YjbR family)